MCIYQNKAIIFKISPPHMLATVFPSLFRDLGPAVTLSALFLVAAGASGREMQTNPQINCGIDHIDNIEHIDRIDWS